MDALVQRTPYEKSVRADDIRMNSQNQEKENKNRGGRAQNKFEECQHRKNLKLWHRIAHTHKMSTNVDATSTL